MKKTNFFTSRYFALLAMALFVIFQSCSKSGSEDMAPAAAEQDDIAALAQAVAEAHGVTADLVAYHQDQREFLVDGDGVVSLADARSRYSDKGVRSGVNETAHKKSDFIVAASKVSAITIYCDATVRASWVAAVDSAIKNWNASGSKVRMQRVQAAAGATTKVVASAIGNSALAKAEFPDWRGNAGNQITINTEQNEPVMSMKIFAITHELGHVLGLSHTNGNYGSLIAGTPVSDPYSIMNSVCLNWVKFSDYDLKAIQSLYPGGPGASAELNAKASAGSEKKRRFAAVSRLKSADDSWVNRVDNNK